MFPKAKVGIIAGIIAAAFLPGLSRGEGFTLTQTVSTSLMYESNANLVPTTGGRPESDYSLRITPKLELLKKLYKAIKAYDDIVVQGQIPALELEQTIINIINMVGGQL